MLTPREAFKCGFVKECQDQGLTEAQTLERIEQTLDNLQKQAIGLDALNRASEWLHSFKPTEIDRGKLMSILGLSTAFGAPFLAGMGTGVLGSKLKGNFVDDKDVKNQELVEELRRQTQLAKQQQRLPNLLPGEA